MYYSVVLEPSLNRIDNGVVCEAMVCFSYLLFNHRVILTSDSPYHISGMFTEECIRLNPTVFWFSMYFYALKNKLLIKAL